MHHILHLHLFLLWLLLVALFILGRAQLAHRCSLASRLRLHHLLLLSSLGIVFFELYVELAHGVEGRDDVADYHGLSTSLGGGIHFHHSLPELTLLRLRNIELLDARVLDVFLLGKVSRRRGLREGLLMV